MSVPGQSLGRVILPVRCSHLANTLPWVPARRENGLLAPSNPAGSGCSGVVPPVEILLLWTLLRCRHGLPSLHGCCTGLSGQMESKEDLCRVAMAFKCLLPPLFPPWGFLEHVLGKGVQVTARGIGFLSQKLGWGCGVWVSSRTAFPARRSFPTYDSTLVGEGDLFNSLRGAESRNSDREAGLKTKLCLEQQWSYKR